MAEFELKLGGKVDLLSPDDMRGILRAYQVEQARGFVPRRFGASGGIVDSTGKLTIGGAQNPTSGQLGPNQGFVWSIKRIAVRLDGNPNIAHSIYSNAEGGNNVIRDVLPSANGWTAYALNEVVLMDTDQLCIVVPGAQVGPPSSQLVVSGMAVEVPRQLLWKLLG